MNVLLSTMSMWNVSVHVMTQKQRWGGGWFKQEVASITCLNTQWEEIQGEGQSRMNYEEIHFHFPFQMLCPHASWVYTDLTIFEFGG